MPIEPGNLSLGVLAGGLIGTYVGHTLSISRMQRTSFNDAAAIYRCAFTKEIRLLEESTPDTNFIDIFSSSYVRHRNAIIRFKPYLSETRRDEIERAWQNHCYPADLEGYEQTMAGAKFLHYDHAQRVEMVNGTPSIIEEHDASFEKAKECANNNISKLLSFAESK